jgi:hypothetical protein
MGTLNSACTAPPLRGLGAVVLDDPRPAHRGVAIGTNAPQTKSDHKATVTSRHVFPRFLFSRLRMTERNGGGVVNIQAVKI